MSNLFGRKVEIIAGNKKFSGDDFTIEFDVSFDDGATANDAELKIYNLSTQTAREIKKGANIILNAGYTNDVGAIFLGVAKIIQTDRASVDHITKINALDGNGAWADSDISKTYSKNATGKQILNDLLSMTGLQIGALILPVNKVYKSGKTVKGKLGAVITEVANDCGCKTHVTRGKIYIREKDTGDISKIILDADSGLIGSPTPIEKEEKYSVIEKVKKQVKSRKKGGQTVTTYENKKVEKTRTISGWKITCLLNHRITTDLLIGIKSKTANGTFRVESGKHYSNGADFYTEMECYPL